MNLAICICTYNRNHKLLECLKSIEKINLLNKSSVKIIIVDNTINNNSYNLIKKISKKFKDNISYCNEKRRGVVYARNKCLEVLRKINPTYVSFFDDDCIIDKGWMVNIQKIKRLQGANIITGPQIHRKHRESEEKLINYSDFFEKKNYGLTIAKWASTNNVFFKYNILKQKNLSFDIKLNKFGMGEDQLFFSTLNKMGNKILWYEKIIVFETTHPDRSKVSWLKNRSFRLGILGHYIDKKLYGKFFGYSINYLKSIFFLILSINYIIFLITNNKKMKIFSIGFFYRFCGKLTGPFFMNKINFK